MKSMDISERDSKDIQKIREKIKTLTIQNDFIFCQVMQNKHIYEKMLTRFLSKVITVVNTTSQAKLEVAVNSKAVCLDILAEDNEGNHYNIEMQVVNNDSIPKRIRMYQSCIDIESFKEKHYKYATDTIIIFICMFDPIGEGFPIYTFKNICEENTNIELKDGTLKMILCPKAWKEEKNAKKRAILKYICDNIPIDSYTKELDMCVQDIKYNKVISYESLVLLFKLQDAEKKGKMEGKLEGKLEIARAMIHENCPVSLIVKTTGLLEEEINNLR